MKRGLRIQEVADRLGYSHQSMYAVTRRRDFPPPCERVGIVLFYDPETIDFWAKTTKLQRRKRRPHK
jgi:predicted DNA-binding transcriptional regulator AlpA